MLGVVTQIVENGLIGFGNRPFDAVDFQRPDWVRGSLHTTFQLSWLVEILHIHEGGELFSLSPTGLE